MKKLTFSKMVQNTKKPMEYVVVLCFRAKTRKNLHSSSKNEKIDFSHSGRVFSYWFARRKNTRKTAKNECKNRVPQ